MIQIWLWNTLGWVCVGLAAIGAVLPLIPTTPFLLVAAYAFSKGSKRFHHWLMHHRWLGPYLAQWQAHRALDRDTKRKAMLITLLVFSTSIVWLIIFKQWTFVTIVSVFAILSLSILMRIRTLKETDQV